MWEPEKCAPADRKKQRFVPLIRDAVSYLSGENMTVKRELAESFKVPSTDISESILNILKGRQSSYKYVKTAEVQENYFKTTIKPNYWPLFLSTKFEVQIIPNGSQSKVVAKTISQRYLFGDIFGMYNGYIQDFFSTLRNKNS